MHLYTYLILLFTTSELVLLLSKRSKGSGIKSNRDKRSLLLLWITIPISLTAGGFASAYGIGQIHYSLQIIAICIISLGFITRWIAIIQLGKLFTVDVAIASTHTLKTGGLYKIVRHPSYLGLILIIIGLALYLNNAVSLLVMVVPIFLALNYRIRVEEKALTAEFGEQYIQYKKKTAGLFPFIY